MMQRLTNIAPQALSVLHKLAIDETVHPAVRRSAAADILDRAGFSAIKSVAGETVNESLLSDMSTDALRALVDKLGAEIADRATLITDAAPTDSDTQPAVLSDNPLNTLKT